MKQSSRWVAERSSAGHRLAVVAVWVGATFAPLHWVSGAEPSPTTKAESKPSAASSGITFSVPGGVIKEPVNVALQTQGKDPIRFTLDGREPDSSSKRYTGPVRVSATTVIKAKRFPEGAAPGTTACATYTMIDADAAKFTSSLPLVIIDLFGQSVDNISKFPVSARFIEIGPSGRASLLDAAQWDGRATVKLRGHSSLRYPKRSYSLKTTDASGQGLDAPLLDLPKDNDWVLYAPYPDKTLMRNVLAYEMSRAMGHYASRSRFVELFVNPGSGKLTREHYLGVYVLLEKITRGKERVNIAKLETASAAKPGAKASGEADLSGGYIFKKDHFERGQIMDDNPLGTPPWRGPGSSLPPGYPTGPGGFPADPAGFTTPRRSRRNAGQMWELPDRQARADAPLIAVASPPGGQGDWFRDLLFGPGPGRSGHGGGPRGEMFGTRQGQSFFYVEPEEDKITPAQKQWLLDYLNRFERALHGAEFKDPARGYAACIDPDSFIDHHLIVEVTKNIDGFRFSTYYQKDRGGKLKMEPIWDWDLAFGNANGKQGYLPQNWYWPQLDDQQYSYFRRLFEDPDFGQRYVDRYAALRPTVFSPERILARIDQIAAQLDEAQKRNFKRWPILGQQVWPNYHVGQTYAEDVAWMKNWIRKRMAWIDKQFVAAPQLAMTGADLTLTADAGTIYYTLDGTDPRAPGGEPSAAARKYSEPLTDARSSRLVARAQVDSRWSAPSFWPPQEGKNE